MDRYVLKLDEIGLEQAGQVGGKGASLGELSRIEGVSVPGGFCVTTDACRLARVQSPDFDEIPEEVASAITRALEPYDAGTRFAVRSSATDEDRSGASFAGQYESFLDLAGTGPVLEHIRRCWASLDSERARAYRENNRIEQEDLAMAVVVQRMVDAEAAGVLFTADPATSNRKSASVEAVFGLGEAMVAGQVSPDTYTVQGGEVRADVRDRRVLGDEEVLRLERLGRRIEAHFGSPQDIEWCLSGGEFQIVQSRPITTLFPVPLAADEARHVYISVGHQQMMTDAMKPLGISLWKLTTPRPMCVAANRLFVDVAGLLASPAAREPFVTEFERSDPLTGSALRTLIDRGFIPEDAETGEPLPAAISRDDDPAETQVADPAITAGLIARNGFSIAALKDRIGQVPGPDLVGFIRGDLAELRGNLFSPESQRVIVATMDATSWLNEKMEQWLGEKGAADVLTRSAPGNVSAEMGLALLDVADAIRPHPEVVAFLEQVEDDGFLDRLGDYEGGGEARDAIQGFLDRYGMRCVGEIDFTRPRWAEQPAALLPMILRNVRNAGPGASREQFERGARVADEKERELLDRLRELPDGERRAAEAERRIELVRTFTGYREYPKYGMVSRYFVYKLALLGEAARLEDEGLIEDREDIFFLDFDELEELLTAGTVDRELIDRRRREYASSISRKPPRVITSEGEVLGGSFDRDDLPDGALTGLAVSAGTVEGRARIVHDLDQADLQPGDILITAFTDPSWAPAFVGISGLVTEVGGLMTHGAVVAREYGLPAVVSVEGATRLIRDGQRIRVNGADGYVEILD
jgi:pyruvate,water dikinase